jgi:lysophospholipase L1-like esterase
MRSLGIRLIGWTIVFLVTLEVCARVDDWVSYGASLVGPYDAEVLYTYDELGKTGRPGAHYQKWKLNSHGFRGPDLQPGRTQILCIGASETFGLYEGPDGEWPRHLERILNNGSQQPLFNVVNSAYPGMSLSTALRRLPVWISQVRPRVIVIYPSLAAYISPPPLSAPPAREPKRPFFEPRIAPRLKTLLKDTLPQPLQDKIRSFETQRAAANIKVAERLPDQNIERFRQDVQQVVSLAKSNGIEVVLVTHATLFGNEVQPEFRPMLRSWRKFYPMLAEDGFLDMERRLNDVLREEAQREGALLVDAAHEMPTGYKAFVEFVHFTDEGAEALARLVASKMKESTIL